MNAVFSPRLYFQDFIKYNKEYKNNVFQYYEKKKQQA